jgi:hypothetical protein
LDRINGPSDDPDEVAIRMIERMMACRSHRIKQKTRALIEACSTADIDSATFRSRHPDVRYTISLLLGAISDKAGRGRSRSFSQSERPKLRTLRIEAGMTQPALVNAAACFSFKSLRRYEHSEPADPAIAHVLTERLSRPGLPRPVTVKEITF